MDLKCRECGVVEAVSSLSAKTLVCPHCGGRRDVANPKEGIPSMSFIDSGTGKKRVL